MKQITHYILGALLLLLMAACQKDESRISFGLQVADHYNGSDSKVYMDGYKPKFIEDEAIKINGESYLIDTRGGSPAVYDVAQANEYYAVYPASWVNGNASTTSITFPDMQKYKYDEALGKQIIENPMVAYANSNGEMLRFYNVASLAKVQITNNYGESLKIKYVALYTDNTPLSGLGTIDYFKTDTAKVRLFSGITNVSIDCSELPALANGETKEVTFALPPIKNVKLYVDVYMTSTNGNTKYSFTKETAQGKTIGRNEMGVIKVTLNNGSGPNDVKTCGLFWGSGASEADPFIIMNKEDLINFKNCINNNETFDNGNKYYNANSTYYLQTANIDISDQNSWIGIGTSAKPFKAKYDGSGAWVKMNIYDLYGTYKITAASDGVGLFAFVGGSGEIKNLTAKGKISSQERNVFVGGIVGKVVGAFTIDNCHNEIPLYTFGNLNYTNPYGGICGYIDAGDGNTVNVKDCINKATLTRNTYGTIGGICGSVNSGTVIFTSNTNTGTLSGTGTGAYYTGGICGYLEKSTNSFVDCINSGNLTSGSTGTGGIVGYGKYEVHISGTKTKNTGTISGTVGVGGIIGYAGKARINQSSGKAINDGPIIGSGSNGSWYGIGGIVGIIRNGDTYNCINNCWNKNSVTSTGSVAAGGIIGYTGQCTINCCKNSGIIDVANGGGNGYAAAGGIVGFSNGGNTINIYNCGVENSNICTAEISNLRYTGGIVGYGRDNYNIINCYAQVTSMFGSSSNTNPKGSAAGIFGLLCTSHTVKMENVYTYFYANSGKIIRPTIHNTAGTVTTIYAYCNSAYQFSPETISNNVGYPTAYYSTDYGTATTGSFYTSTETANTTLGAALRDYRKAMLNSGNDEGYYMAWTSDAIPKLDWIGAGIFSAGD